MHISYAIIYTWWSEKFKFWVFHDFWSLMPKAWLLCKINRLILKFAALAQTFQFCTFCVMHYLRSFSWTNPSENIKFIRAINPLKPFGNTVETFADCSIEFFEFILFRTLSWTRLHVESKINLNLSNKRRITVMLKVTDLNPERVLDPPKLALSSKKKRCDLKLNLMTPWLRRKREKFHSKIFQNFGSKSTVDHGLW